MPEVTAVDDIDGGFVPRPRGDVAVIDAGREKVLIRGKPYALNETAALVWDCFDGEVTLDELVLELARSSGADEETIRQDVVALTRRLASVGMLDGFAPRQEGDAVPSAKGALGVGEEFPGFVLPDLDGNETSWGSFRGRQVLLVSWHPRCGFCVRTAEELGELQGLLDAKGVSLVFLTRGDAVVNRGLFSRARIDAPALVRDDVGPFAEYGTPAAYLVDADGKVSAPFAYGADAVPLLARRAAGLEEEAVSAQYLAAAPAVCGGSQPGAGGPAGMEWSGTAAYRFGRFHVGIRYNTEATAETLDRLFPGMRIEDPRVPDNLSVVLEDGRQRTRSLNLLLNGSTRLVRSRSRARVLRGLLNHLSGELTPPTEPLFGLRTPAVVRGRTAMVLPAEVAGWAEDLQPRLNRFGFQLVDVPCLLIDPDTAELVVTTPPIDHDASVIEELGTDPLGGELPSVVPGRYQLGSWIMLASREMVGPVSPVRAVVQAAPLLVVPHDDIEPAARALVNLFEKVEVTGVALDNQSELLCFLQEAG